MNISLPDEMKAFVEAQASTGGYASASEYVCALVRDAQRQQAKHALEARLLEGLEGPLEEMTHEDWDAFEQEAQERFAREQAS